jgi:hypothetical protein
MRRGGPADRRSNRLPGNAATRDNQNEPRDNKVLNRRRPLKVGDVDKKNCSSNCLCWVKVWICWKYGAGMTLPSA